MSTERLFSASYKFADIASRVLPMETSVEIWYRRQKLELPIFFFFFFFFLPGMAGFDVQVDDNGDVEFNMTLLDFVNNDIGERGKLK